MCTLAIFVRVLPGIPLAIAANRDEFYARPATGPVRLDLATPVVPHPTAPATPSPGDWLLGGRDLVAGGSWLSLAASGLVVGVLNRRTGADPDPTRRSRGELCTALGQLGSATLAAERLRALPHQAHNPFNVVVADRRAAFLGQNLAAGMLVRALDVGVHVLTNLDLNDPLCPRVSRSARRFEAVAQAFQRRPDRSLLVEGLRHVLADHTWDRSDPDRPLDPLCIHGPVYGTRSSTIVLARDDGTLALHHAATAPCRSPHRLVPLPSAD